MGEKENKLERKLNDRLDVKISMDTDLNEFARIMRQDYRTAKRKEPASLRAYCMLGYLNQGKLPYGLTYWREPIQTVGELYSFKEKELLGFSCYRGKTWKSLSEHLVRYGLPPLKLPQVYTAEK